MEPSTVFPEIPVFTKFIGQFLQTDALTLKFSLWRVFSVGRLGTVNKLPEGEGEGGSSLAVERLQSEQLLFGCLTVNYGHTYFFFFFGYF